MRQDVMWRVEQLMPQDKQLTKWQIFSLKMTTLTILGEVDVFFGISSTSKNIHFLFSLR